MFKVTNRSGKAFQARYNGHEYLFPKDEPVYVDEPAALHIFGIGQQDKTEILSRHGWATYANTLEDGMKILNAFKFEHIAPKLDAPLAIVDHGPAPVGRDAPEELAGTDGPADDSGAVEAHSGDDTPAPPARATIDKEDLAARLLAAQTSGRAGRPPARQSPAE